MALDRQAGGWHGSRKNFPERSPLGQTKCDSARRAKMNLDTASRTFGQQASDMGHFVTKESEDHMKRKVINSTLFLSLVAATVLSAQEAPEFPKPQKEHEWLNQFVGEWDSMNKSAGTPGQPEMECKGTMSARMLGGFWVISESNADMMGTEINSIQTIGYDPEKKKYVGTWVDSAFNHLWQYEGTVDESGKKLSLEATGPNMVEPGKTAKYRDSYEFKSADEITVKSEMSVDGEWVTFMNGTMKRKK